MCHFLEFVLKLNKKVIISTGATDLKELTEIFDLIITQKTKTNNYSSMHIILSM